MNFPILIVDDKLANRVAMKAVLDLPGFEVVAVASGAEALRCLVDRQFGLILLDVNMPGMDGFETAEMVRGRPASAHTPIIFITARGTDTVGKLDGYPPGTIDYVLKPVDPDVLLSKVAACVESARHAHHGHWSRPAVSPSSLAPGARAHGQH